MVLGPLKPQGVPKAQGSPRPKGPKAQGSQRPKGAKGARVPNAHGPQEPTQGSHGDPAGDPKALIAIQK